MRRHLIATAVTVVIGTTLLLTAAPAQAYTVIDRKVTFSQPFFNGAPVVFVTPRPAQGTVVLTTVGENTFTVSDDTLVPVEVTIRERHRHHFLGIPYTHVRTRVETQWVPASSIRSGATPVIFMR